MNEKKHKLIQKYQCPKCKSEDTVFVRFTDTSAIMRCPHCSFEFDVMILPRNHHFRD